MSANLRLVRAIIGFSLLTLAACPNNDAQRGPRADGGVASPRTTIPSVPPSGPVSLECAHTGKGRDFPVGVGKKYTSLGDVPFESLTAGDTVRVHWRPEPYREKLMIGGDGTAEQPIRICGVRGPEGQLPVIDGDGATTREGIEFPYDGHQPRGLIIVGHRHDEPWKFQPKHFLIEGLEIRNATAGKKYTDRHGKPGAYSRIAAGIYVQRADYVTIRGCDVHDNQTGLFIGGGGGKEVTRHVRIVGNHIHNNGDPTRYYEHNVYNEAVDVLYEYNWMQSPRGGEKGVRGSNIKERSSGVVIRYNWIEDGAHLLDIVDAQEAKHTTRQLPEFHVTYVYGNVFVLGRKQAGTMIHYGGNSHVYEDYRKGTLFFFNNTVAVYNRDYEKYWRVEVFDLSTNEEHLVSFNNVYWSEKKPTAVHPIVLMGSRDSKCAGIGSFETSWVADGWGDVDRRKHIEVTAEITGFDALKRGVDPGFHNAAALEFKPSPTSVLRGAGRTPPPEVPAAHHVTRQPVRFQRHAPRADSAKTIGALD